MLRASFRANRPGGGTPRQLSRGSIMKNRPLHSRGARALAALSLILAGLVAVPGLLCPSAKAAESAKANVPVEKVVLDNGLTLLLVRKPEKATVTAGWVAHVGSSNEHPGMTGISHLFEHMMFKGSHVIGTKNIKRDLQIIDEQEKIQ